MAATPTTRPAVAHVGPDHRGRGGMGASLRTLLGSPLAQRYRLVAIPSHRAVGAAGRALIFARSCGALTRFCLGPGPRLVHVHATVRGSMYRKVVLALLAHALRRPVVLHVHAGAGDLRAFHGRLGAGRRAALRLALRRADAVVAVSAASASELRGRYGAPTVDVIPNAAPEPPAAPGGAGAGPTDDVVFLGGFANPVKGGDAFVDALDRLARSRPSLRAIVAGPGTPPARLERLCEAHPGIRWRGYLDEAAKDGALRGASVFVLASTSEGLPVALLEAMAYGKAIVATRVGGVPDTVRDGTDAVLVDAGDPDALAAAIAALLDDPARAEALGAAARSRAVEMGAGPMASRVAELYERVLGRHA